jgi:hypothetical protein
MSDLGPPLGLGARWRLQQERRKIAHMAYPPRVRERVAELIEKGANHKQILERTPFRDYSSLKNFCYRQNLKFPFRHHRRKWTDDEIEQIRFLLNQRRLSPRQIAHRMGVSRNAVVGKIWRHALRGMMQRPDSFPIVRKNP